MNFSIHFLLFYLFKSQNLRAVRLELEAAPQHLGRAAAHQHAFQKDFEIIQHGADFVVNLDIQRNLPFFLRSALKAALEDHRNLRAAPQFALQFNLRVVLHCDMLDNR